VEAEAVGLDDELQTRPVEVDAATGVAALCLRIGQPGFTDDSQEPLLQARVGHYVRVPVEEGGDLGRAAPPCHAGDRAAQAVRGHEIAVGRLVDRAL
jgi:hypothetical protein